MTLFHYVTGSTLEDKKESIIKVSSVSVFPRSGCGRFDKVEPGTKYNYNKIGNFPETETDNLL